MKVLLSVGVSSNETPLMRTQTVINKIFYVFSIKQKFYNISNIFQIMNSHGGNGVGDSKMRHPVYLDVYTLKVNKSSRNIFFKDYEYSYW